jgi:hypothetical protein
LTFAEIVFIRTVLVLRRIKQICISSRGDCMPGNEGSQADLDYALSQTAGAPPPPPPADLAPDPIQQTPGQPDANGSTEFEYDGSSRRETHSAWSAAKEVAFNRKRRGQEGDGSVLEPIVAVQYQDGRPLDQEVSAKEAASDLSAYRREQAQRLLTELTGEAPAQPEAAPTPQPEQPTFSSEQLEMAEQRQQTAQQWQAAQQASGDYQNLLTAGIASLMGQGLQEFADIKTQAVLAALAEKDPARFSRLMQADQQIRAVQGELARIRTQQAEAYTRAYQQFAEQHDAATEKLIPELAPGADPRAKVLLQQTAADLLKEVGYSDHELRHAWQNGGQFMLRDARAQKIIADAARWRISQAKAKEALRMPVPQVVRPGVRQLQSSYDDQQIHQANKQLDDSGKLMDAVRMRRLVYQQRRQGG